MKFMTGKTASNTMAASAASFCASANHTNVNTVMNDRAVAARSFVVVSILAAVLSVVLCVVAMILSSISIISISIIFVAIISIIIAQNAAWKQGRRFSRSA